MMMGSFSLVHWLVVMIVFFTFFAFVFVILRLLWRLGDRKDRT